MGRLSKTPTYNLRAVLRETGLSADVLRIWERRYGLPLPQRTPGGHRLYSDHDLAVIQWLQARQNEGLSISRAAELWKALEQSGRDPLEEFAPKRAEIPPVPAGFSQIDQLRSRWVSACLAYDASAAEDALNQAFAMFPLELACTQILQKGVSEIGQRWYQGGATVQQEHFATTLAAARVEALLAATPKPTRGQTILLGCPAGEWHSFPAQLLNLLMRRRGLNVVYLGANLPLEQMEQTAAAIQPDLVVLAAQHLAPAAALQSAAFLFQRLGLPLAYGGLVFNRLPELRARIPAAFLGEELEDGVGRVEQLLLEPAAHPIQVERDPAAQQAVAQFRARLPLIEAFLMERLVVEGLPAATLMEVNAFFAAGLAAAIDLGSPGFFESDLEWAARLMAGRGFSAQALNNYLAVYRQAVATQLGAEGKFITGWISTYLANSSTARPLAE